MDNLESICRKKSHSHRHKPCVSSTPTRVSAASVVGTSSCISDALGWPRLPHRCVSQCHTSGNGSHLALLCSSRGTCSTKNPRSFSQIDFGYSMTISPAMFLSFNIGNLWLFSLFAAFFLQRCHSSLVSAEYNCTNYNATANLLSLSRGADCVSALSDKRYEALYDVCRNGTCFIFKGEPPLVKYNVDTFYKLENRKRMQRPFKCGNPKSLHPSLGGIVFELHKKTSSRDDYCVWAGHPSDCTWNALVDYIHVMAGKGYRFVISGPMLETPQRKCYHHASGPWLDSRMVIIGRSTADDAVSENPLQQLVRPFETGSWVTLLLILITYIILGTAISYGIRKRRGGGLITALFVLTGDLDHAVMHEARLGISRPDQQLRDSVSVDSRTSGDAFSTDSRPSILETHDRRESQRKRASLLLYSLAINLIRVSFVFFVALFVMFYELSLVNFVFQQQNFHIKKDVDSLSQNELKKFSIMKNSALENIWNRTGRFSRPCHRDNFVTRISLSAFWDSQS